MSQAIATICAMSAILVSAGCQLCSPARSYSPLTDVTRIEIKTGPNKDQVHVIEEPAEVARIVDFVNEHQSGWGGLSDWAGVPVPQVSACFYNGSKFKGHFGVGPGFFECQRDGDFSSKRCVADQEHQFLDLVGFPDMYYPGS